MDISLEEFRAAEKRIAGLVHETPMEQTDTFSRMTGGDIRLKCENQQKTGSFKIRGAGNKLAKTAASGNCPAVIAPSAGNHAQGLAYSATKLGLSATIVMPANAPIAKVQATEEYGAKVVLYGSGYDESYEKAVQLCRESGAEMIHPYDDTDVITGQGTLGLEMLRQAPDADVLVIPAGGGGLLAGVACAAKKVNPRVKVYGVQAESADALVRSFEAKKRICTDYAASIADGIAVANPGVNTSELICRYVDGMVTVTDDQIANAVLLLMERGKQIVEGAGAASVAAVLSGKIDVKGKKVVCLLSGGNIDVNTIGNIITRALSVRYRRLELYTVVRDRKEDVLKVADLITRSGAAVMDLSRDTSSGTLKAGECRLYIRCETRGKEHRDEILATLKENGYPSITGEDFARIYREFSGR